MKTKTPPNPGLLRFLCFLPFAICLGAWAQGTAFTYQGQLTDGGAPAQGNYDLRFAIYDVAGGGSAVAGPITNSPVAVSNGLFTVTLDFGAAAFNGSARWLDIGVRTNGSVADFTRLNPRQPLTPTPYAISAGNLTGVLPAAQLTGTLPSAQLAGTYGGPVTFNNGANVFDGTFYGSFLGSSFIGGGFSGQFIGDGSGLINLNASQLAAGIVPDARLGTNILRTSQVWTLTGNAGTTPGTHFLGTTDNQPLELKVNSQRALRMETYASGPPNVLGGAANNLFAPGTVGGMIGGGTGNQSGANYSAIVGGAGGYIATYSDHSAIGGGLMNTIQGNSATATIAGGKANSIDAYSACSFVGGGTNNTVSSNLLSVVIVGGQQNTIGPQGYWNTIGGGLLNHIQASVESGTIAGGRNNSIGTNSIRSVIGGGYGNTVAQDSSYATIAGGLFNIIDLQSSYSTISGGERNEVAANSDHVTIAGGWGNAVATNAGSGTISGGRENGIREGSSWSAIGGGFLNNISADSVLCTVGGGYGNVIGTNAASSTIGGGNDNSISANAGGATIAGGITQEIGSNSVYSALGGGWANRTTANANYATIPGGDNNVATNRAFAAGSYAKATNSGSFVWSDGTSTTTGSASNNTVTMRASGGFRFFTGTGTSGAQLPAGATAWSALSDRNLKKDIQPLDCQAILDKLAGMPLTQWHYTWEESTATPHVGPMAQDFKAAFYPGRDDKSISTLEFDGVALAAIQGLNEKVEAGMQNAEVRARRLEAENAELKLQLERLESLLLRLTRQTRADTQ